MSTNITPAEHLDQVQASFAGAGDPRLSTVPRPAGGFREGPGRVPGWQA
jgi:hypothetical protein